MSKYEDIKIGTHIHGLDDEEEMSRTEELAVINPYFTKITSRSKYFNQLSAMFFWEIHTRRTMPLEAKMAGIYLQSEQLAETYCDECGGPIDINEYAIWSGGKHYCMECGRRLFSEYIDYEGLMCTRCGEDIEPGDDIWGFDDDSGSEQDMCMCSRCAYITHRFPVWEQMMKEI